MITSYITTTEAGFYFPNHTDYAADVRANALKASYGLVNSFINPKVKIPAIGKWNGEGEIEAPEILKICQGSLYRYILQSSTDGFNEELENLYESIANKLRGITQGEISIPTSQTFSHEAGWHIVEKTVSTSTGDMEVRGTPPDFKGFYDIFVVTGGYVEDMVYRVTRDDSSAIISTNSGTYETWQMIDNRFEVRFNGQFTQSDSFSVMGVPSEQVDAIASPGPVIQQGPVVVPSSSLSRKLGC